MADIIPVDNLQNKGLGAKPPLTVAEAIEKSGWTFDHKLFRQRLRGLRAEVIETGGIIFIPLIYGMPIPMERWTKDNKLLIDYRPVMRVTYSTNTLREPVRIPPINVGGGVFLDLHGYKPDPMIVKDVKERVEAVANFSRVCFPTKINQFNQNSGVTVMTDEYGEVSFSLNCPYPLSPAPESPLKMNHALDVPFHSDFATRVYLAAYLHEMGCSSDLICKALSFAPHPVRNTETTEQIYSSGDVNQKIIFALEAVPSLGRYFVWVDNPDPDHAGEKIRKWHPPGGSKVTPEAVFQTILSTAHFLEDGNISFEV